MIPSSCTFICWWRWSTYLRPFIRPIHPIYSPVMPSFLMSVHWWQCDLTNIAAKNAIFTSKGEIVDSEAKHRWSSPRNVDFPPQIPCSKLVTFAELKEIPKLNHFSDTLVKMLRRQTKVRLDNLCYKPQILSVSILRLLDKELDVCLCITKD